MIKKESIFPYLFLLTGFFVLLEISFFIQSNKVYLADFTAVSDKLAIPLTILPGVAYFLFAQILVHVAYTLVVGIITLLAASVLSINDNQKIVLGIGIWLLGMLTIVLANQIFFPNSKFADLTAAIFFNPQISKTVFSTMLLLCGSFIFLALLGMGKWFYKQAKLRWFYLGMLMGLPFFISYFFPQSRVSAATQERPNIILVGVDSLRPDFLSYFGARHQTPFFDAFLSQATVFSQAVTPLARTFPSWTSILTGQYPRQTGVRFNLASQRVVNLKQTLPAILQGKGYETIYATDETRFSNISKHFGFDHIITPPMGLNDFLIGTFNDFPLSNLLINTIVGKWLFPHSYGNRPVYFTYNPDSFLNRMRPALNHPRNKPVFLAVHFCLSHHPYLWASFSGNNLDIIQHYEASIARVDKQLKNFFILLKEYHYLDHAIVVLLSDHGEALELHGDRITKDDLFVPGQEANVPVPKFYPPSLDDEKVDQSAGHGTDVLGLPQYHSLLAFKLYGVEQSPKTVADTVSLLDIKPTLLDLLGMNKEADLAGISLASLIKSEKNKLTSVRHLFLESDFSPEAIRTVYPETRKVLLEGVQLFQIDPQTTLLTYKASMANMIIKSKQYADIYGEWMLALYPQMNNVREPILIHLTDGKWTNDLHSSFAQHSPAVRMLAALKAFYGYEIEAI